MNGTPASCSLCASNDRFKFWSLLFLFFRANKDVTVNFVQEANAVDGVPRLVQRVRTLEIHQRLHETGKWSKNSECITKKHHQVAPKIYRAVRLQNTVGVASWEPEISTIMRLVEPVFQKL